jgi:hypothetical protein
MQTIPFEAAVPTLKPYVRAHARRAIADSSIAIVQPYPGIIRLDFGNPPIAESFDGKAKRAVRASLIGRAVSQALDSIGPFLSSLI